MATSINIHASMSKIIAKQGDSLANISMVLLPQGQHLLILKLVASIESAPYMLLEVVLVKYM